MVLDPPYGDIRDAGFSGQLLLSEERPPAVFFQGYSALVFYSPIISRVNCVSTVRRPLETYYAWVYNTFAGTSSSAGTLYA